MSALSYSGKNDPSKPNQIVTRRSVDLTFATGITRATVDQKAENAIAPLARTDYVDGQDANLATPAYVSQQDGLLIPNTQRGAANGIATLDSSSKVPVSQLPVMGKGKLKGPYFPTARNAAVITPSQNGTNAANYAKVGAWNLPAPGFRWRPMIFGSAFGLSVSQSDASLGAGRLDIECRHGNSYTGTICAAGRGHNSVRSYQSCAVHPNTDLTPQTGASYSAYSETATVDISIWLYCFFGGARVEIANSGYIQMALYLIEIGSNT